jgi:DUF1009 family protein
MTAANTKMPNLFNLIADAKSSTRKSVATKKIGLVAGWGRFPIRVAEALKAEGYQVYCLAIKGHADPALKKICFDYRQFGLARMGAHVRYLRRAGVTEATMAGKIFKTLIFRKAHLLSHVPDLTFCRYFYPVYVSRTKDRRDDTLLHTVIELYADYGITFQPATNYAPELLVKRGCLTRNSPSSSQLKDIRFGWAMAKEMGRLDIGQSVVVKNQAVMAVEAIEGTDECIRRAGRLCQAGGFTVIKVAKPRQDMRFDVPTIGIGTVQTIHESGGRVLAIEADKTIVLDQEQTIAEAQKLGIAIIAFDPAEMAAAMPERRQAG